MIPGFILRGLLPLLLALPAPQTLAAEPAPELYRKHCSECHGADRFGLMGPALLPENLSRLGKPDAAAMIRDSRPTVQMPAFKDVLSDDPDQVWHLTHFVLDLADQRRRGVWFHPPAADEPTAAQQP